MAPNALTVTAAVTLLVGLGHTAKGGELFDLKKNPAYGTLSAPTAASYRNGWYQGSVFFIIAALQNYRWGTTGGLTHQVDKPIVGLLLTLYLVSAYYYRKGGDSATAVILSAVAGLQGYAAFA